MNGESEKLMLNAKIFWGPSKGLFLIDRPCAKIYARGSVSGAIVGSMFVFAAYFLARHPLARGVSVCSDGQREASQLSKICVSALEGRRLTTYHP